MSQRAKGRRFSKESREWGIGAHRVSVPGWARQSKIAVAAGPESGVL